MKDLRRMAFFIPNTFTALNMSCGFLSVLWAVEGKTYLSCMILVLAGILDSVDGRIARLTKTQSAFGEQFDSLSDVISFGMAPAILIFYALPITFSRAKLLFALFYLLCTAMRLARFNANLDKVDSSFFQGIPSPLAAMSIVGPTLFLNEFSQLFSFLPQKVLSIGLLLMVLMISALMISKIPFYSFKNSKFPYLYKKTTFVLMIFIFCSLFLYEQVMILFFSYAYILGNGLYFLITRKNISSYLNLDRE